MKPKVNRGTRGGKYDDCQTPGYALDPLEKFISPEMTIWEPAAGEGYLVRELEKRNYNVISSSIEDGYDFFDLDLTIPDDTVMNAVIVTNPPYSQKYRWIEQCYELGIPWFLLMPVETFGAESAQKHFRKHGVNVIFLSKRINFKMPNQGWKWEEWDEEKGELVKKRSTAQFPVAWFFWKGYESHDIYYHNYDYLTKAHRQRYEV